MVLDSYIVFLSVLKGDKVAEETDAKEELRWVCYFFIYLFFCLFVYFMLEVLKIRFFQFIT